MDIEKTIIKRGDMYYVDFNPVVGSEQNGIRPAIVIQNNMGNRYSPTYIVAAVTSRLSGKSDLPTHVLLSDVKGLPRKSVILLEQIRTIDNSRICSYITTLDSHTMKRVDEALAVSIGLYSKTLPLPVSSEHEMCLCAKCADQYYQTHEYYIRRRDMNQTVKEKCDFCNTRSGYDFIISSKKEKN